MYRWHSVQLYCHYAAGRGATLATVITNKPTYLAVATTLSITSLSIMTFGVTIIKRATPHNNTQYRVFYAKRTSKPFTLSVVMHSVIMQYVVMLSVVAPDIEHSNPKYDWVI